MGERFAVLADGKICSIGDRNRRADIALGKMWIQLLIRQVSYG